MTIKLPSNGSTSEESPWSNYHIFLKSVALSPITIESRLGPTREIQLTPYTFIPGEIPFRNRLNLAIGWTEGLQMLAGIFTPERFQTLAPNAQQDLFTANMAYGPRIASQLPTIVHELIDHPNTRRAVLLIDHPDDTPATRPCTTSIQFILMDDRLQMHVSMRSWDLVKGLPYDVMMFGMLHRVIAHVTGHPIGLATVVGGSCHIYEADLEWLRFDKTANMTFYLKPEMIPDQWEDVPAWAAEQNDLLVRNEYPPFVEVVKR